MCSIIGFNGIYDKNLIEKLCFNSRIRGLHSFGFSFYDKSILTTKKYLIYNDFIADLNLIKPNKFIAHFRYSTSGDYKIIDNNQPLTHHNYSIVFNGVVSQKSKTEMEKEYGIKLKFDNDGYILLEKYNDENFVKAKDISFAMIALFNGKLIALRNENRPMHYFQDNKTIVFASTKDILSRSGLLISNELMPYKKMII